MLKIALFAILLAGSSPALAQTPVPPRQRQAEQSTTNVHVLQPSESSLSKPLLAGSFVETPSVYPSRLAGWEEQRFVDILPGFSIKETARFDPFLGRQCISKGCFNFSAWGNISGLLTRLPKLGKFLKDKDTAVRVQFMGSRGSISGGLNRVSPAKFGIRVNFDIGSRRE